MPQKRKAAAASLADEPPARRLRSGGLAAEVPAIPKPKSRTTSRTRAPASKASSSKPTIHRAPPSTSETRTDLKTSKKRVGRPPGVLVELAKTTVTKPRSTRSQAAIAPAVTDSDPLGVGSQSKKARNDSIPLTPILDDSDDELNFLQTTNETPRPSTPSKTTRPREFLHSVELTTPKHHLKTVGLATDSPTVSPRVSATASLPISFVKVAKVTTSPPKRPSEITAPALHIPSQAHFSFTTPSKKQPIQSQATSPTRLVGVLPPHLHPCLNSQKKAIMGALRNPPSLVDDVEEDGSSSANDLAYEDVCGLLGGTVSRGEGNSCLLIGPRGSGKTRLIERALEHVSDKIKPIVIRLSGHAQRDDRLAMREIAWQLTQQTGNSFISEDEEDREDEEKDAQEADTIALPPPAHLPALISVLPRQQRPVVVVLDAFDNFALHGRQALLYCLLDTAQSCRVGGGNSGIAVVGVTTRVDTLNLLEKRVKSRFSGRMFRTAGPEGMDSWKALTRSILAIPIEDPHGDEWSELWNNSVDRFLGDRKVVDILHETWALAKDVRVLSRILTTPVIDLTPASPHLSARHLEFSVATQRFPVQFSYIPTLSYPSICLLIAAIHSQTSGHDTFTFEMLYQAFRDQVRSSMSAPVQVEGGSIGMVKCGRHTLMGAFEQLANTRAFVPITASAATIAKEFVKYRCAIEREDVKKAVDKIGHMSMRKWFGKSQQTGKF